jgi:hypothetical protein
MYGYGDVPSDWSHDDKTPHDIWPPMYRYGVFLQMGLPNPADAAGLRERERKMGAGSMDRSGFFIDSSTRCMEPGATLAFNA